MKNVVFESPGKGPWELESTHFTRPLTKFSSKALSSGFTIGGARSFARYGMLLDRLQVHDVNGFLYFQPVPYGAPAGALAPPPKPVLWLLARINPKLRARIATSHKAFTTKLWRRDLEQWDNIDRPALLAKHAAIAAVDVAALSDEALAAHIDLCFQHLLQSLILRHELAVPATLPVGDFIASAQEWTGESVSTLLALLRGSSPVSTGVAGPELDTLIDALRESPAARAILASPATPAETIKSLAASPEVGAQATTYFRAVHFRSMGYDVGDLTAGEMPEVLLGTIRTVLSGPIAAPADDTDLTRIRHKVPARHLADFDERLAEARMINRLRDERGASTDSVATGLARRALLECGRRLHQAALVHDPAHAVELDVTEAAALLCGQPGPTAQELADRYQWRTATPVHPPLFLTAMPSPPPTAEVFPPAARRPHRALTVVLEHMFKVSQQKISDQRKSSSTSDEPVVLRGLSVNTGTYEGIARVIHDSTGLANIQPGDVLVTRMSAPHFNVVLPMLGAIVTDRGGQLSHAAIVAREYGIPGVVGTRDATTVIPDGAKVRVDGSTGEVRIVG